MDTCKQPVEKNPSSIPFFFMFDLQFSLSISLSLSYRLGFFCDSFISLHFLFL